MRKYSHTAFFHQKHLERRIGNKEHDTLPFISGNGWLCRSGNFQFKNFVIFSELVSMPFFSFSFLFISFFLKERERIQLN